LGGLSHIESVQTSAEITDQQGDGFFVLRRGIEENVGLMGKVEQLAGSTGPFQILL
jgi:hypothetical protein